MQSKLYFYRAQVISVYDGDTCTVDIDLGMGIWNRKEKLRFYRINTPEIRGDEREEGLRSRDFLRALIDGKEVFLQTVKDKKGKYGRCLAKSNMIIFKYLEFKMITTIAYLQQVIRKKQFVM